MVVPELVVIVAPFGRTVVPPIGDDPMLPELP